MVVGQGRALPSFAAETRSLARVDVVVNNGGIANPFEEFGLSVIIRADETGALNAGDVTVSMTEDAFTSEEQIRRFISGEGAPISNLVGFVRSPDVPQLESREITFSLGRDLWTNRLSISPDSEPAPAPADSELPPAGVFGIETSYTNRSNQNPSLRELSGRQVVVVVSDLNQLSPAAIAPIVSLTASPTGGLALRPEELQALTVSGGALDRVTSAVTNYPVTLAIDGRILASISALGDLAPRESTRWADRLGQIGLAQFSLPWADADPLGSLEIDTLAYARLGEYPWLHGNALSLDELVLLNARSASAVLVSSSALPSDRAVVSIGDTRVIRVDDQLSRLAKDALQAPTILEAEADLQRAQGIIAYRSLTGNQEVLVFSAGRLPATAIAPRIESVLSRFGSMPVATTVAVPLTARPTEVLTSIPRTPATLDMVSLRRDIRQLWQSDVAFASITSNPESVLTGRWTRYQSLLSSAWLEDPNALAAEWTRAQADSGEFQNSVRIEQGSSITVLSDETALPITLVNDFNSDVSVVLSVRPATAILAIEEPLTSVLISRESSTRVFIPVQSLANGTVSVELSLLGPDGNPIGELVTVPITIRAGWEGVISVGLALLVGGTFAFGIVRAVQRRRSEKVPKEETDG
jgi:voltage-gated potassium channel Kch